MIYQFYTVEITQNENGQFAHDIKWYWDSDLKKAQLKGESGFYEILSRAALSNFKTHSVILFNTVCEPLQFYSYNHNPKISLEQNE